MQDPFSEPAMHAVRSCTLRQHLGLGGAGVEKRACRSFSHLSHFIAPILHTSLSLIPPQPGLLAALWRQWLLKKSKLLLMRRRRRKESWIWLSAIDVAWTNKRYVYGIPPFPGGHCRQ